MERVNHAGDSGVLSKGNDAAPFLLLVGVDPLLVDALIVEQLDVLVQNCPHEGHVLRLALDDVREEQVALVGDQAFLLHLLHPQDQVGGAEVLGEPRARILIFLVGEDPVRRRLDEDTGEKRGRRIRRSVNDKAVAAIVAELVEEGPDVGRAQWGAPLPLVVRLAHYAQCQASRSRQSFREGGGHRRHGGGSPEIT